MAEAPERLVQLAPRVAFWRGAVVPVRGARVLVARRVLDVAEAAPASLSADVAAVCRNECLLIRTGIPAYSRSLPSR
ncbi:MAG: hypothetical protein JWP40_3823 [Blastococcus sp.]|nr:hypothetical protein [Blastococcus sp.]